MDVSPHAISALILANECLNSKPDLVLFVISIVDPPPSSVKSFKDPTLQELVTLLTKAGGDPEALLFPKLKELCLDPDHLIDLFDEVGEIVAPVLSVHPKQTRNAAPSSLLGLFIRRTVLSFNNLMFDGVARLFDALVRYVEAFKFVESKQLPLEVKTKEAEFVAQSRSLQKKSSASFDPHSFFVSASRQQTFVRNQAEQLPINVGRVSYAESEQMLTELAQACGVCTPARYLRYLTCQHHKEFEDALESLHSYFDHLTPQENQRSVHQYAILNLAILHFSFGHLAQATHAAEETVRIAQQFNDHVCLSHALGLLASISQKAHGDTPEARQFLQRCVAQQSIAAKLKLEREQYVMFSSEEESVPPSPPVPTVESTSWLALAKFEIDHIQSKGQSDPQAVWAALRNSTELNTTHNLQPLMSTNFLVRSGAWKLFGSNYLSNIYASIQLRFYGGCAAASDTCLAVLSTAANPLSPAEDANHLQEFARTHWPHKADNGLEELTLINSFQKAFVSGDLEQARTCSRKLSDLVPSNAQTSQFYLETKLAEARLQQMQGEYESAVKLAEELVFHCEKRKDPTGTVQCTLLMAQICQDAGDALLALPYVLKCLGLCKDLTLDTLEGRVRLTLAKIHLALGSAREAVDTVAGVLPQLLENGEAIDEVDAYCTLGRAMLSLSEENKEKPTSSLQSYSALAASLLQPPSLPSSLLSSSTVPCTPVARSPVSNESTQRKRSNFLNRALHYLKLAAARCEEDKMYCARAKEVFYLLARLYHHFEQIPERDEAALRFSKSKP